MSTAMHILVVDDDRSTQRVLSDALKRHGFEVTVERDGEWALKTFQNRRFDLVLLDVLLPAVHGYEVARQMRELPFGQSTPIIMISGVYKNAIHQREAVQKHGAFAFLEKPIDLRRLTETVRAALGDRFPRPGPPTPPKPPPPPEEENLPVAETLADDAQREEIAVVERQAPEVQSAAGPAGTRRGDFSQRPFAEVLAELYRARATGALLVKRKQVKKIVYLRQGTPELVKSNLLVECLGRILVREKMISEAECQESLKRMRATRRMQGTVLVEMGCMSPHNLQYALVTQLAEKLYDLFRWDSGEYHFNAQVAPPPEPLSLGMTCAQLIHEGVRRAYDAPRLARVFGGVDQQYVHPSERPLYALQDAGLGDDERALLLLADGHKTVGTLRALKVLPPLETDRLLFAMTCAQMIELKDRQAEGRPRLSFADIAQATRTEAPTTRLPPPLPRASRGGDAAQGPPPSGPPPSVAPASAAQPSVPPPLPKPTSSPGRPSPLVPAGGILPEVTDQSLPWRTGPESLVRERLAQRVAAMQRLTAFEVLGVTPSASPQEIKSAFVTLAREYHPDRHSSSASAEVRALAQRLYELISSAHETLMDPRLRERYEAELAHESVRPEDEHIGSILAAEGKFQRGEELLRQRNFAEAHRLFREAVALYEPEGEFHAHLGWSLFQMDPTRAHEAERAIERGIVLSPKLDKGYLFLGYLHKAQGRPDKAEKQFERALQCNPDCTEALRELRLLGKLKPA